MMKLPAFPLAVGVVLLLLAAALPARAQTARFRTLHSFAGADGQSPAAGLLLGEDGNFYGTTAGGGTNGTGTLFRLTPAGGYTVLLPLDAIDGNGDNQDGKRPIAPLIQDAAGNLFGTTPGGGATDDGTLFMATTTGGFTKLHDFGSGQPGFTDGAFPNGGLAFLPDGTVAGVASNGGDPDSDGVVFFFGGDNGFSTLNLGGDTGATPVGSLAVAPSGFIYGVCNEGGGGGKEGTIYGILGGGAAGPLFAIYQFPATDTNHVNVEGVSPEAGPIVGRDGNLYGTANDGGPNANGTVWQFVFDGSLTTGALHVLHAFNGPDGSEPSAPLVQGSDGSFYGTTEFGGANDTGVVFRVTTAGAYTVLHNFSTIAANEANADGEHPQAGLTEVRPGSFVGTAAGGGTHGDGTAFELDVAPLITSAATAAGNVGSAFSYQIVAGDGAGSYSAEGLGDGLTLDAATGLISGTPTSAGTLHLNVHASNDVGTATKALAVTVKGPVPVVTSAKTATAVVGKAFSYTITASGATSFGVVGLQPGLTLNKTTGVISGTPRGPTGTFALTLKAANAGGVATAPLTLTVGAVPAITSAAAATAFTGQPFSFQITATNSPTSFTVGGLKDGLALNKPDGLIFGTPTTAETLTLTVDAYNAHGHSSQTFTLTVKLGAPVITSTGGPLNVSVGQPFSYQITATNDPTSFAVGGLADGLTLNKTTGVISGLPGTVETLTLTLHALNGGGQGSKTLTVNVNSE